MLEGAGSKEKGYLGACGEALRNAGEHCGV